jgi:bifunctional DNA-binding transcriptional regulator/antitoxin component of YhaV-PrlF toxin-antitoxin module
MDLESSVATARKESKSVRATIPEGIVAYLRLEVGDKLEWVMEMQSKERVVIVKKKKR